MAVCLVDAPRRQALSARYAELVGLKLSGIALHLGQRFDPLDPHSSDKYIADLVDAYLHQLGGWLKQFEEIVRISGKDNADALLWTQAAERSNPQKRHMMTQLSARLEKRSYG
ncbi:hypothetical protein [Agrobacterium sp. Azo12]|uniref:hypothetical protein n=1 Tax=Agrobacterium sp. Azo12 TaxID=3031129 RepID=UPI0023D7C50A|nr:hypothetical protein [Agrobacterium sp. Azo12]MDO5895790.1 hypothetical protein [Agrobacterium sp. Azo12]